MVLEQELTYFEAMRDEWLRHYEGQVALVKGEELHGTFTTSAEAFEAGVHLFGTQAFLIKKLEVDGQVVQYPALSVGMISAHSQSVRSRP